MKVFPFFSSIIGTAVLSTMVYAQCDDIWLSATIKQKKVKNDGPLTLAIKVKNTGDEAVKNAYLRVDVPSNIVQYGKSSASPKLKDPIHISNQFAGWDQLYWNAFTLKSKKSRGFEVKGTVDKCASQLVRGFSATLFILDKDGNKICDVESDYLKFQVEGKLGKKCGYTTEPTPTPQDTFDVDQQRCLENEWIEDATDMDDCWDKCRGNDYTFATFRLGGQCGCSSVCTAAYDRPSVIRQSNGGVGACPAVACGQCHASRTQQAKPQNPCNAYPGAQYTCPNNCNSYATVNDQCTCVPTEGCECDNINTIRYCGTCSRAFAGCNVRYC